jgi:flagellar protein FlaG
MMIISMSNGLAPARAVPDERQPPPSASVPASAPVSVPTQAQVQQAAQMINKAIQSFSSNLEFSVDDAAVGKTVVRVVDKETGEMIRQIPSREALDIARALDRLHGLLLQNQA